MIGISGTITSTKEDYMITLTCVYTSYNINALIKIIINKFAHRNIINLFFFKHWGFRVNILMIKFFSKNSIIIIFNKKIFDHIFITF